MRNYRDFGSRFEQREWHDPRSFRGFRGFRGYGRPDFGQRGEHHQHGFGGHFQQPTPEQQVLRSTAFEVARLFAIAARSSYGNTEKQAQLRNFLENARTQLTQLITSNSQNTEATTSENTPEVEQA
jgi:hypothetical protein